jgi:flagellar M-ring protein FliF
VITHFRNLSQEQQLGFAAALLLVLVALIGGAWLMLRAPYRPLFTHLRTADAAAIVDELDHKHTPYELADDGATIMVPAGQVDSTRLALMNGNLALKGTVGFELFNKSDMGLTDFAQRINYQRALQGELERTIMSLEGVEESRVHLSLGEDRLFREDRVAPKASVTIRMRSGTVLATSAASGIQRLVAAAVPQLEANDVVILDDNGQVISSSAPTPVAPEPPEAAEQTAVSAYYAARIRDALARDFPADQIKVAVHAGIPAQSGDGSGRTEWNPAARDFPLRVMLEPAPSLDASARQDIQGLAAGAIGFDASRGDIVGFGTVTPTPEPVTPSPAPPARSTSLATPSASATPHTIDLTTAVVGGTTAVLVLVIIAGLLRRRARIRPLSAVERARLASQLDRLLNEEGRDGMAIS